MSRTDLDIDSIYPLSEEQLRFYRENGFIKLKQVLSPEVLAHYGDMITAKVLELNPHKHRSLAERSTYHRAFIQISNLWEKNAVAREFVFGKRLARIAAQLMGTRGSRLYHDQALYKEPGGGYTPWHADQQYWPLASDKATTAWVPLQATPVAMGPLSFAAKSHTFEPGRDLEIGDESERRIQELMTSANFTIVEEPFDLGEVSFHSGWTFHRAGPNNTSQPRAVMTVIYLDEEMRLAEPANKNQVVDRDVFCPGVEAGEIIDSPKTPLIYTTSMDRERNR